MLEALDADAVRLWSRTAVDLLAEHSAEIDALNVYPVADADTGSNTLTTLRGGDAELRGADPDAALSAAAALATLATGAARAALGNSGFLLSQVLRGLADAAGDRPGARTDGATVAAGLTTGARLARSAVVHPVEGTILTVAQAAAEAATGAPGDLQAVVTAAVRGADAALQRTPSQLADLAQAGVVDAGGRALLVVLAALAQVVTGAAAPLSPVRVPLRTETPGTTPAAAFAARTAAGPAFEVQYDLEGAEPAAVATLGTRLAAIGDSVAIVPTGAGTWKVHVHVDDVGRAIEAGLDAGRPRRISVVRFDDAANDAAADDAADDGAADAAATYVHLDGRATNRTADATDTAGGVTVLAVAPGAGLAHLFATEGVHLVEGGADDLPEAADVDAAITAAGARHAVLLPNATRVAGVAEAAAARARGRGVRVSVIPTRSPVQGLAAIAVHDPTRAADDDVVAMAEAAAATRFAEITVARAQALTAVGVCEPGDVLGLIDGEVVDVGRGALAVAFGIVDRLLAVGAEMMTVLVGRDAPRRAGELIEAHVHGRAPLTEVHVYPGGQSDHLLIIGVE